MVHAMEEMLKENEEDKDEDGDDEELAMEEEIKIRRRCNKLFVH